MRPERAQLPGSCQHSLAHHIRRCWNPLSLLALFSILAFTSSAHAQSTEGNITGTVTASDGALVPNATITVTDQGTQFSRTVHADSTGNYVVSELNPGTYSVKVDAPGFSELLNTAISLSAQQTVQVNAHLNVAGTTSSVTVTAQAPVVSAGVKIDHIAPRKRRVVAV
jgi:hypothetical protein